MPSYIVSDDVPLPADKPPLPTLPPDGTEGNKTASILVEDILNEFGLDPIINLMSDSEEEPVINVPELPEDYPDDNINMRFDVGTTSEKHARHLFSRLAFHKLDIVKLPALGYQGTCLFKSILHMVPHPVWYTVYKMKMHIVWFLVKYANLVFPAMETSLDAKGISYYTLARRLLYPKEWGGLETLMFARWCWKLPIIIINPGHDDHLFHTTSVKNSPLVVAYNGHNHYMPTGKFLKIFT